MNTVTVCTGFGGANTIRSLCGIVASSLVRMPASAASLRFFFACVSNSAPPNPVHTVTVFTDVECGYCRKLHSEIAEYNAQGIAVEYLAFPRMGIGSEDFEKMVSVWCASDRKKALTEAKTSGKVIDKDCKNTVTMQYNVGQRAGLTGTPMILAEDGTQLGGYVPPKALREALDKLAADNRAAGA